MVRCTQSQVRAKNCSIIRAGAVHTSTSARVACSITHTGAESEAVATRDTASEGSTGAVAVFIWISSGQLVAPNALMLVQKTHKELVRRNHGNVPREVVGTIKQSKLLGLGTINNVAFP